MHTHVDNIVFYPSSMQLHDVAFHENLCLLFRATSGRSEGCFLGIHE